MSQSCTLQSLIKQIKSQKRLFWQTNIYAVLSTLLLLPLPMLIPLLIDEILLNHPGKITQILSNISITKEWQIVAITTLLSLVLRVLAYYINNLKTISSTKITQKINYLLRYRILHHLQRVSIKEYESLKSGSISSKTIQDVETISGFVSSVVTDFVPSMIMLLGVGTILVWMNWQLSVAIFVLVPTMLVVAKYLGRLNRQYVRKKNEAYQSYTELLNDTIELFSQVRASNQEKNFFDMLKKRAKDIENSSIQLSAKSTIITNTTNLFMSALIDIFRALGIIAVVYSDLSVGMMIAFLFYLSTIMTPMNKLMGIIISYQKITPAMKRIQEILDMQQEPHYPHLKNPFVDKKTLSVSLQNISFEYLPNKPILKDITIEAPAGKKIALIGASGSGKSTIAHIMVGLYSPQQGDILYDGISIREIGLPVVRANVALMLQNSLFFNDTIKANLTLSQDIDDQTIYDALKAAKLYEFVISLPDRLDTPIGKNGIKLSGGQKQRLAIARLLLSQPKVIIFDEATSALDNQTEYDLYQTLNTHIEGITTIIIAHRDTTIKQADYIYIIQDGSIKAQGTYEELSSLGLIQNDFDNQKEQNVQKDI
jgi:ATP-binding cassette subfamily C protein